jgi:hypothetical protein
MIDASLVFEKALKSGVVQVDGAPSFEGKATVEVNGAVYLCRGFKATKERAGYIEIVLHRPKRDRRV